MKPRWRSIDNCGKCHLKQEILLAILRHNMSMIMRNGSLKELSWRESGLLVSSPSLLSYSRRFIFSYYVLIAVIHSTQESGGRGFQGAICQSDSFGFHGVQDLCSILMQVCYLNSYIRHGVD